MTVNERMKQLFDIFSLVLRPTAFRPLVHQLFEQALSNTVSTPAYMRENRALLVHALIEACLSQVRLAGAIDVLTTVDDRAGERERELIT